MHDTALALDSETLATGLPSQADVLYLLARPVAEDVQPAAALASTARDQGVAVGWVLIGDRPHDPAEVAEVTGTPVAAVLPNDHRAATAMSEGRADGRGRRSRLSRAIAAFAAETAPLGSAEEAEQSPPSAEHTAHESKPLAELATEVG